MTEQQPPHEGMIYKELPGGSSVWAWPEATAGLEVAAEYRRITKLAFRNRFTKAEKAGIEFAALDDPTAPIAQRQQAAALRADLKDQEQATFIDLDDEDTRTGVITLEAVGLIAAGRAVEILDAPVQDKERLTG